MNLKELEEKLEINFQDKKLLEQAFVHRSYINENGKLGINHNERLEFLGDAVLELITSEFLFNKYKNVNEGDMSAYRASLVNAITLGEVARGLGFNDLMKLSKGEAKDLNRARSSILADAYEAFLGAMYLDKGLLLCKDFVNKTLLIKTDEIIKKGLYKDSKSKVQEKAQELLAITPHYKVIDEEGPDHDKIFNVAIYFGDQKITEGAGKSKQEAETDAAKKAIQIKGW